MERLRLFLLLVVLSAGGILVLSPGCMTDPVTGKRSLGLVNPSDDEEVREGQQYAAAFTAEFDGVYPDDAVNAYCAAIVTRMAALSHRSSLPFRFTLLNSSVPNAFALPGGEVFMTRGLLVRLDEEAMFAVIMGHEIGHVSHRHSVKGMNDALVVGLGSTILAGAVEDERNREIAAGLANASGQLLMLRFSRDQELESDALGVEYSYKAGYDPRRGTKVFEEFARMKAEAGGGGGLLESWTSSHPLDEDRIANLKSEVNERYPSLRGNAPAGALTVTTNDWTRLLATVRAVHAKYEILDAGRTDAATALAAGDGGGASRALKRIEAAGAALPDHALFPAVEGAILHRLGDRKESRQRLQRAVTLDPGLYFARMKLAAVELDDGRPAEALPQAEAAAALVPNAASPRLLAGHIHEALGRQDAAVASYEAAARLSASGSGDEKAAVARLAALDPARYGTKTPAQEPANGGRKQKKR
jgi:predicted Zn-dependent protease